MYALIIQAMVMLGCISCFLQSRRVTEGSVLHAAASSLVYGLIEQMKSLDQVASKRRKQTADLAAPVTKKSSKKTTEATAS